MAITQEFDLNLIPDSEAVVVKVNQYDDGTGRLKARLYVNEVAYTPASGASVRIEGTKPDKHGFSYTASISGNLVTADLTTQMTAIAGRVRTQIIVEESSGKTGTFVFWLDVQAAALADDTDISDTDIPAIEDAARQNAARAEAAATSAVSSAAAAAASAQGVQEYAEDAEAYAVGTRDGADVPSSDVAYHNNSKYYAGQASTSAQSAAASAAAAEVWSAHPPYIGANGNWYIFNTTTQEFVDSGIDASITVEVADITMIATTATPYVTNTGSNTDPIFHLFIPTGTGITGITKTGSSGLVDTYTISLSNGTTTTFNVTNGADGEDGKTAYESAVDGGYSGTEAEFYAALADFQDYADTAADSATAAAASETAAATSATQAKSWAVGPSGTGTSGTDTNNAKYWAGRAESAAQGGILYIASVTFANLPALASVHQGWMYNIQDDFTTTSDFQEGAGIKVKAGANVVKNVYDKWDLFSTGGGSADESEIAPVEETSTASQAYAVNDLFIYDGKLYKVTVAIASGGTITPDTNCVETSVSEAFVKKTGGAMTGELHVPGMTIGAYSTIGTGAFSAGNNPRATGNYSVAFGNDLVSASGAYSFAHGSWNTASGQYSHAEGAGSRATGNYSHAEGGNTQASQGYAHAEGYEADATGIAAHAEGGWSEASGYYSHAEGYYTIAGSNYQHTSGKFNDNKSTNAFEIGNGTDDNTRSNALEVTWGGDVTASGDITDGDGNVLSEVAAGTPNYTSKMVTGTVDDDTLEFTDSAITSTCIIDGPYIADVLIGLMEVEQSGTTITYTLEDDSADGASAYIWVRTLNV